MQKRVLIILVILTVLGVGGYFAWQAYQTQQTEKAAAEYAASSDKIADDFIRDVQGQNLDHAYNNLFSSDLKSGYSKEFWEKTLFTKLKNSEGTARLHLKQPVTAKNPNTPSNYDPRFHQDPTRYEYDFTVQNLTYRITMVIYKENGQWKINELSGDYQL